MRNSQGTNPLVKLLMIFVGISGCFSVLFGAWLAHGGQTLSVTAQSSLQTAQQYQLIHTLALLASLVWAMNKSATKLLLVACISFFIGILCFSGTIYIKTFFDFAIIGKVTPLGGLMLAFAWFLLSIEGIKNI
ncbi:MAG: DUF423 domain-containing protein [Litorilituus sp.]|jgi:uncharacterized membrane protein YgdD (TMEM256/DUF423 family)|nr:DUF423 domain-containing protein [Litorilituus sp.]